MQITSGLTRRPAYDKSHYQQEMARARQQQQAMYPGMYNNGSSQAAVASSSSSSAAAANHASTSASAADELVAEAQRARAAQSEYVRRMQVSGPRCLLLTSERNTTFVVNYCKEGFGYIC